MSEISSIKHPDPLLGLNFDLRLPSCDHDVAHVDEVPWYSFLARGLWAGICICTCTDALADVDVASIR